VPAAGPEDSAISAEETVYLCEAANRYFEHQTAPPDVVWSYAGIRALYDDGAGAAQAVTRDYRLELDPDPGAKLLSVFGGKITTARALAQEAMEALGIEGRKRTVLEPLPGGDIMPAFLAHLEKLSGWLPAPLLHRLATAYGTRLPALLRHSASIADLGRHFGAGLYEAEVRYLSDKEFARTAEDILWRRTKLGLGMTPAEAEALASYLAKPSPRT
jgi:glycerol-3-phosphate dehydrogenase